MMQSPPPREGEMADKQQHQPHLGRRRLAAETAVLIPPPTVPAGASARVTRNQADKKKASSTSLPALPPPPPSGRRAHVGIAEGDDNDAGKVVGGENLAPHPRARRYPGAGAPTNKWRWRLTVNSSLALSLSNTTILMIMVCLLAVGRNRTDNNAAVESPSLNRDVENLIHSLSRRLAAQEAVAKELEARLEGAELALEIALRSGRGGFADEDDDGVKRPAPQTFESKYNEWTQQKAEPLVESGAWEEEEEEDAEESQGEELKQILRQKRDATENVPAASSSSKSLHLVNLRPSFVSNSVSHWVEDPSGGRSGASPFFEMRQQGSAIRVTADGLYLVYAQLWFDSRPGDVCSFEIEARRAAGHNARTLAACSNVAPKARSGSFDQTCFTLVTAPLRAGEMLSVRVGEVGRRINAEEEGRTFFGIVRIE